MQNIFAISLGDAENDTTQGGRQLLLLIMVLKLSSTIHYYGTNKSIMKLCHELLFAMHHT